MITTPPFSLFSSLTATPPVLLRLVRFMLVFIIIVIIASCKKKDPNPEKVSHLLLEQDETCRIVSYKWDVGSDEPWEVVHHYNGVNLDYYITTHTSFWTGKPDSKKRVITYSQDGNPENVDNLVRFKYDKNSLLESVTTYVKFDKQTVNKTDTVPDYKAYFTWKDGRIIKIVESFFQTIQVAPFTYEFQELAPWSYSTFTYDDNGNIITNEVLDYKKEMVFSVSYMYDKKPNPLKNRFLLSGNYRLQKQLLSKNNCIKITSTRYPDMLVSPGIDKSYQYGSNNYPLNAFLGDGQFIDIKYECK